MNTDSMEPLEAYEVVSSTGTNVLLKFRAESEGAFSSRDIGLVSLKTIYFHYLKNMFSGRKYPKYNLFVSENRSTGSKPSKAKHRTE